MTAIDFGERKVGNDNDQAKSQSQAETKLPPFYKRKHGGILRLNL
jgi:hypothetical protein